MHALQTLTVNHDRFTAWPVPARTPVEIYHWTQSAASFHKKLSLPIKPDDRDALWATAALLGIMSFASIDVSRPEDAWPLTTDQIHDLEWLNMSLGKRAVWDVTDPLRPDSVFSPIAKEYMDLYGDVPIKERCGIHGLDLDFVRLCKMNELSSSKNNVYFSVVHHLAPLLDMECDSITATKFMAFLCKLTPEFKQLLHEKDPTALLIFCFWYAKVLDFPWFVARRARLEGQSICLYLRRYCSDNSLIQDMVSIPESNFRQRAMSAIQ
jgi:hypothetical protein